MAGKGVCQSSAPKRLRVFLDSQYILKILAMTYDLLYKLTIDDMIHPHNSMFHIYLILSHQKKTYIILRRFATNVASLPDSHANQSCTVSNGNFVKIGFRKIITYTLVCNMVTICNFIYHVFIQTADIHV